MHICIALVLGQNCMSLRMCTAYLIAALPVVLRLVRPAPHQLVNGLHDVRQFGATDAAVTVQVIQFEGPSQPLVHGAPQQRGQRDQQILFMCMCVCGVSLCVCVLTSGRNHQLAEVRSASGCIF